MLATWRSQDKDWESKNCQRIRSKRTSCLISCRILGSCTIYSMGVVPPPPWKRYTKSRRFVDRKFQGGWISAVKTIKLHPTSGKQLGWRQLLLSNIFQHRLCVFWVISPVTGPILLLSHGAFGFFTLLQSYLTIAFRRRNTTAICVNLLRSWKLCSNSPLQLQASMILRGG